MTSSSAIEVENLTKRYGEVTVVDRISVDVAAGEFLTLLGPSGCGKTTCLRCIAGFIKPDDGKIRIGGEDVNEVPPYRRHLGMVFQNYALFPHLTVFENVAFGLRIRSVPNADAGARVNRALEMVRLGGLGSRLPRQLSGGQQQRVALARALVYGPRVLLLDEPLSNLDAKLRVEMRNEIRDLQQELGVTAVYVTHDQEEALAISDRIAVLNGGRIEQLSAPWEVYNKPNTLFVASFIGAANVLEAERVDVDGSSARLRIRGGLDLPICPSGLAPDNHFWAVIRPEHVEVVPETDPETSARGVIRSITMLGAMLRAEIELAESVVLLADIQHGGELPRRSPGDPVSIRINHKRIVTIPRSNA